jgi:PIN domain nuclease of toxin-antitoxin system
MILLDTHVLVWLVGQPQRLSPEAASATRRAHRRDGLAIASITLWELALLFAKGLLRTGGTIEESIRLIADSSGVVVKPITPAIAALAISQRFPSGSSGSVDRRHGARRGLPLVLARAAQNNLVRKPALLPYLATEGGRITQLRDRPLPFNKNAII